MLLLPDGSTGRIHDDERSHVDTGKHGYPWRFGNVEKADLRRVFIRQENEPPSPTFIVKCNVGPFASCLQCNPWQPFLVRDNELLRYDPRRRHHVGGYFFVRPTYTAERRALQHALAQPLHRPIGSAS